MIGEITLLLSDVHGLIEVESMSVGERLTGEGPTFAALGRVCLVMTGPYLDLLMDVPAWSGCTD